ncbi:MAG TPA: hypothetical protein V6C64_01880 [Microcoleaceae cyanobacterium]|jgi:hypothetical protein
MSEAANSHFDPDLSETSASVASTETEMHPPESVTVAEDDWQTVDLPGAVSVDAILAGQVNLAELTATPEPSESTSSSDAIAQLDRENATLREQIQQLEQDLTQAQIELQLEIARSLYSPSTPAIATTETSQSTPEGSESTALPQIEQLAQELELAQQSAQRQQILVETLTNQLHSSQERIAQLERECALTQQRYNEQMQQLVQSENTCRDLRMRLMRQQQHTLQFKAALEKCLDMPAALQQPRFEIAEQALANQEFGHAPFVPKAHPVKPWSTEGEATEGFYTTAGFDLSGLPNLLSKLRTSDDEEGQDLDNHLFNQVAAEPLSVAEPQQMGELLNLMFPETVESPVDSIAATPAPESIFDISPFMQAGEVPAAIEPAPEPEITPAVAESQPSVINMWDDLAQLIDPTPVPEPAAPETTDHPMPTSVSELLAATSLQPVADAIAASESSSESELASESSPELSSTIAQHPSKRPILLAFPSASAATEIEPPVELASEPDSMAADSSANWTYPVEQPSPLGSMDAAPINFDTANAIPANWPSPVLYPLRPTKRLQSLAAVELPTFRRG